MLFNFCHCCWDSEAILSKNVSSRSPGAHFSNAPETFRARKAIAKFPTLRLQSYFIHRFLKWKEVLFIQEVSGVYTSSSLDTDELKMALRARKVSGAFEKRAPGLNCSYGKIFITNTEISVTEAARLLIWRNWFFFSEEKSGDARSRILSQFSRPGSRQWRGPRLRGTPVGFIAQLVEHDRTGIRGGHGFESRWSPDFFSGFFFPNA